MFKTVIQTKFMVYLNVHFPFFLFQLPSYTQKFGLRNSRLNLNFGAIFSFLVARMRAKAITYTYKNKA